MKAQSIVAVFLIMLLPVLSFAQQNQRELTPEQLLEARRGELANFDNYTYRYLVAAQEGDLQSMEDIRAEMLKIMESETANFEKQRLADGKERMEKLRSVAAGFKTAQLELPKNSTELPASLDFIHQYRELVLAALQEMEAAR
mgnify:CR=1 FL=1